MTNTIEKLDEGKYAYAPAQPGDDPKLQKVDRHGRLVTRVPNPQYEVCAPDGHVIAGYDTHSLLAFSLKEAREYAALGSEECGNEECDVCQDSEGA